MIEAMLLRLLTPCYNKVAACATSACSNGIPGRTVVRPRIAGLKVTDDQVREGGSGAIESSCHYD